MYSNSTLTDAVYDIHSLTGDFLSLLFISMITSGLQLKSECWFKFPLCCIGCDFGSLVNFTQTNEERDAMELFTKSCNVLLGTPEESIIIDDLSLLKELKHLANYEPKIRPNFPVKCDSIKIGMKIVTIEDLDITDSSFMIDFILYQEWKDERLVHHNKDMIDGNTIGLEIWKPDTYFVQSKKGAFNYKLYNSNINVRADGTILYRSRLLIKVSCSLDFHNFPMDEQLCILNLESYGHESKDINYEWGAENIKNVLTNEASFTSLSQYSLQPIETSSNDTHYIIGVWSTLSIKLKFIRNSIIFIPAMYFPCAIIVFISWITFLLDPDHYPARTYLCVTSMLTIVTMQAAMNLTLPQVSYIKAIDVYVLVCTLFIALAFMEYAFILCIKYKRNNYVQMRNKNNQLRKRRMRESISKGTIFRESYVNNQLYEEEPNEETITNDYLSRDPSMITCIDKIINFHLREGWPRKLDTWSRILFPSAFILFNIVYWCTSGLVWVEGELW